MQDSHARTCLTKVESKALVAKNRPVQKTSAFNQHYLAKVGLLDKTRAARFQNEPSYEFIGAVI